jgi:hypothetical protein
VDALVAPDRCVRDEKVMNDRLVTKLEAATRQLDTAIALYFEEGDAVSIHTLACAAHQVIHDINRHRNGPELLFDALSRKPADHRISKAVLHRHYNYFKHADNDPCPNCGISFDPKITEVFMLSAIQGISVIKEDGINQKQAAFVVYMQLHNDFLFSQDICCLRVNDMAPEILHELKGLKKKKFLREFLRATG